jgi:hypothetical protein
MAPSASVSVPSPAANGNGINGIELSQGFVGAWCANCECVIREQFIMFYFVCLVPFWPAVLKVTATGSSGTPFSLRKPS